MTDNSAIFFYFSWHGFVCNRLRLLCWYICLTTWVCFYTEVLYFTVPYNLFIYLYVAMSWSWSLANQWNPSRPMIYSLDTLHGITGDEKLFYLFSSNKCYIICLYIHEKYFKNKNINYLFNVWYSSYVMGWLCKT
jgi:hypothetical protein